MKITRPVSILTSIVLIIYFLIFSSCSKEYSRERGYVTDSIPSKDTSKIDSTLNLGFCSTCNINPTFVLNRWSFRNYKSLVCGNIPLARVDSAYLDSGYDVTTYGLQDCANNTDLVINGVFPPRIFDSNQTNVPASYCTFVFYNLDSVILAATVGTPLTMNMVLDSFNLSTGIASIRFFGYAYTNKGGSSYVVGDSSYISDGRIKVKIR